jgi:diguanylate cyclase (GGDEF)-like protein
MTIENHGDVLRSRYPDMVLSVSVGVATLDASGDDSDRMIQRADAALYAAKRHGRNRVCVQTPAAPPAKLAMRGVLDEV